jgi:hypothetical protein
MRSTLKILPILFTLCLLVSAQDPAWKNKPMKLWNADDAKQVLTDSPWSQSVTPQWVRDLSPDERRQGGDMEADQGRGVGLEGLIGIFDSAREAAAIERAHEKPDPGSFLVRWESAAPIQAAEQKVPDSEPAVAPSAAYADSYAIVVYDFPIPKGWNERILKGVAALKRYQKKDFKPSRVILERKPGESTANIVYLFPRSVEITKRDTNVVFQAQIGRLVITRIFSPPDMLIQEQIEL